MKNKERLSLIDDYIKIMQVLKFALFLESSNFSNNRSLIKEIVLLSLKLKSEYEQVFYSINMNDLSMKMLIKDLDSIDFDQFISQVNVDKKLLDYYDLLSDINIKFNKKCNEIYTNKKNYVIL